MDSVEACAKPRVRVSRVMELSPSEKVFLDMTLDGSSRIGAALEAFFPEEDWEDESVREKAKRKYSALLNTKRARQYLHLNRNRALIFVPTDMEKVATHLSDICFGNARRTVRKVDSKGRVVEYEETPSFSDQIAAGLFLKNYCESLEKRRTIPVKFEDRKDEIDEKAKKFTDGWKFRRIDQDPLRKRNLTEDVLSDQLAKEVDEYDSISER